MHYNSEDGCFYGNCFFLPSKKHPHPNKEKGEAIIDFNDIKDVDSNERNKN